MNQYFEKATYNPEDNKLRIYSLERLPEELYGKLRELDFSYAPIQKLFVAPCWTPEREDLCIELCGNIVADEISLHERAEAKAERLDALAEKRAREAFGYQAALARIADSLNNGQPILVGHHSERKARKAERQAEALQEKCDATVQAISYWSYRAQGVERHANHKVKTSTRLNRIKNLLADLRTYQRRINHGMFVKLFWSNLIDKPDGEKKDLTVKHYAGMRAKDGALSPNNTWDQLRKGEISSQEAIERSIAFGEKLASSSHSIRYIQHTLNRLAFEQSELPYETLRFDGKLTAAILQTFVRTHGGDSPKASKSKAGWLVKSALPLPLHLADGKEADLSDDNWRDLMKAVGYEVPAAKPKKPAIVNCDVEAVMVKALYNNPDERLRVIKLTKAEHSAIRTDNRGVKVSACGNYRVRVVSDPAHVGPWYSAPWVVVFLTDSKAHEVPESSCFHKHETQEQQAA